MTHIDEYVGSNFTTGMSAIFLVGELTGAGMLAAPWAVVKLGKMFGLSSPNSDVYYYLFINIRGHDGLLI